MEQFNETADKELMALEAEIAVAQSVTKAAADAYAKAFERVYAIFDRVAGIGKAARFVTPKGMVIERRVTDPDEVLDPARLRELIDPKVWTRITDAGPRTLNQAKLTRAIKAGIVDPELAAKALVKPKAVTSKWYREASKEDKQWLELQTISAAKQLPAPAQAESA